VLVTFWICAFLVIYVYLGYPALIASGLLGMRKKTKEKDIQPQLSVLIPAHNEERVIGAKLRNMLSQNYPLARLEILVGDEGSLNPWKRVVLHWSEIKSRAAKAISKTS
jgi:cellulose synthase/poly-beta-1,6-N-acetylglucosamine synthase-like glycosyltransferase